MIHQAEVRFADGTQQLFLSEDGRWFFERQLPDPHGSTLPMRFEREWLKQAAQYSDVISSIEFTERGIA